jgi:hypothetical protein
MHCPEAAQPTVTFLGTICERGGQLNNGSTLLHYRLQSTVCHTSNRTHHTFPLTAYFKNGQRWLNFPSLSINAQVFITGRVFELTKENQQLAIMTEDVHFLPAPPQPLPPTPSQFSASENEQTDGYNELPLARHASLLTSMTVIHHLFITATRTLSPQTPPDEANE